MKKFLHSHHGASKGAALIIVLALVVLATGVGLAYLTRTTTDRQLAQSSYNDTSADLLARTALDITVSDLKQEIANNPVDQNHIQPSRYGVPPITDPQPIPNLIRRSFSGDPTGRTSSVRSDLAAANGRIISLARWNSHYLIPRASTGTQIDSTPVSSFVAPYWVLVTPQGPLSAPAPNTVIGRYAFAAYDEGGLMNMNLGGFPAYASVTLPGRPVSPARRMPARHRSEESEIMLVDCTPAKFTPEVTNVTLATGVPCSLLFSTNKHPDSFGANFLPRGLSINTINGNITGIPTSPGSYTVTLSATDHCGVGYGTLHLTIQGFAGPTVTPWPVNLARKGTVAFADLTALPATPTAIGPTTPVGTMGDFLPSTQIKKLMGWRNYATTQQPTSASFDNPSFLLASADNYANYFLGSKAPFGTPFTTVPTSVVNNRTDQAVMTRQELIKLQRTVGFSQSLLQYLGTFSREYNRPAPSWIGLSGSLSGARWDMNNLQLVIPTPWFYPGNHGQGHAYGRQRNDDIAELFGLEWVAGTFSPLESRFTDPDYYGHWKYVHELNPTPFPPDDPDFFQIIDYAMNQAIGVNDPNHVRKTFSIGAAIIDQYDTDDLHDSGTGGSETGNTITIIDPYGTGIPANYVYGIEAMSFDLPNQNTDRPPFAPNPPPVPSSNAQLNRRFENVGEFGYACNFGSTTPSGTLDFASAASNDRTLLDFFTYNTAGNRAGIANLNTRNGPVLASIIRGAWLRDPGTEVLPPDATYLASQAEALTAGQGIVQETTSGGGPALSRADVARLATAATNKLIADGLWPATVSDEKKQTIARALAEVGQARTWNLMIDVIAQTGNYAPGTADLTDPTKFIVQGEKRYWLHIALDRDDGTVLGSQLEEVVE